MTSLRGWVRTQIGPRTWRLKFHGPHIRRPWLVLRADGSIWGRYTKRQDAKIWVGQFSKEGFHLGYKPKRRPQGESNAK